LRSSANSLFCYNLAIPAAPSSSFLGSLGIARFRYEKGFSDDLINSIAYFRKEKTAKSPIDSLVLEGLFGS